MNWKPSFVLAAVLVCSQANLRAQTTPKIFYACYVPASGTVYRIKETGLPSICTMVSHVQFSWTDGLPGFAHSALNGLGNDDHPQYLLASGARPLAGNLAAGGN